jgi:hypothetical protein
VTDDDDVIDGDPKAMNANPMRVEKRSSPRVPRDPNAHLARAAKIQPPAAAAPAPTPQPSAKPALSRSALGELYKEFRRVQGNCGCPQPEEMPDGWQPRPKRK